MNMELFKHGIKKLYVLPLVLTILLALMVPAYTFLQKSAIDESSKSFQQLDETAASLEQPVELNMVGAYKELAAASVIYSPYAMLTILILPIVLGVQLFGNSKKNKNRLADFIEQKGLTKQVVYRTNMLTGILLSIAPIVVSTLLLLIIKLFAGMGDYITTKILVNWACLGIFSSALFFVFTALVGFITKSKPLQVLYTYGFLFIPVFVTYLFEIFMTQVIYGFPGFSAGIIEFLNHIPAIKVCQMFMSEYVNYTIAHSLSLWYVLVYILLIAAILFVGYKLINIENKEKLQQVGDKIFKYIWIFIIGAFLYIAFMLNFANPLIAILITVGLLLIVYILKETITKRSFKAILNGKRYYIISGVVIILVVLFSSNFFNYETKVPNAEDVEYMTYTAAYPNKTGEIEFRDRENINILIEKHKNFILAKNQAKDITSDDYTKVYIQYKLKNGDRIVRSYETVLEANEPLFESQEYVEQKYAYMYGNKENVDIIRIAGYYNGETFMFEANRYEHLDLLNEVITAISNDLTNYDIHLPATGEYQQYTETEGIQLLQIGLLDGMNQYTTYLYYLKVDSEYELIKKLQSLITENSEFIMWYEK